MDAKSIYTSMKIHEQNGAEKVMQNNAPDRGEGGGGRALQYRRLGLLGGPD